MASTYFLLLVIVPVIINGQLWCHENASFHMDHDHHGNYNLHDHEHNDDGDLPHHKDFIHVLFNTYGDNVTCTMTTDSIEHLMEDMAIGEFLHDHSPDDHSNTMLETLRLITDGVKIVKPATHDLASDNENHYALPGHSTNITHTVRYSCLYFTLMLISHVLSLQWTTILGHFQGIQSACSIHAINLLTSGLFTVNAMWSYWNVLTKM